MEGYVMLTKDLLEYIEDAYTIEEVLNILGKDMSWLLWQIRDEILESREDFFCGDDTYSEVYDAD